VFAPAAAALAAGTQPADIGLPVPSAPVSLDLPQVEVSAGKVSGCARYVDDFGNVLTGITTDHLMSAFGDLDPGRIGATVDGDELGTLCRFYSQRSGGTLLALLNAWDRVELSVCEGRAVDRFAGRPLNDVVVELRAEGGR
jgi:S-adenosylmethionine hydrolase